MRFTVRAPATVANLGPGFDSFGVALDLWNEVEVDTDGPPGVTVEGEGAGELSADEENLVAQAMAAVADRIGAAPPPTSVRCRNAIPLERGLGSSAAATVAGIVAGQRLCGAVMRPGELLELAVEFEGHADNAAACLFGGITIAYTTASGWAAEPLEPEPSLRPVALVPEERGTTVEAREALPETVPIEDAVFNVARAGLLVRALTAEPPLLAEALQDRLHQDVRLEMSPASKALFDRLWSAGVPTCVAGAGPSLLAFELPGRPVPEPPAGWRRLPLAIAGAGAWPGFERHEPPA